MPYDLQVLNMQQRNEINCQNIWKDLRIKAFERWKLHVCAML